MQELKKNKMNFIKFKIFDLNRSLQFLKVISCYINSCIRRIHGTMVTVIRNRHRDQSSNPEQGCLHFT